ncbi:hypothetical protein [Bradyrhizobium sp. USDA 4486]
MRATYDPALMAACLALSDDTRLRTLTACPLKITFGEMREMGLHGVLVYCHCGHHVELDAVRWPGEMRLSDL